MSEHEKSGLERAVEFFRVWFRTDGYSRESVAPSEHSTCDLMDAMLSEYDRVGDSDRLMEGRWLLAGCGNNALSALARYSTTDCDGVDSLIGIIPHIEGASEESKARLLLSFLANPDHYVRESAVSAIEEIDEGVYLSIVSDLLKHNKASDE